MIEGILLTEDGNGIGLETGTGALEYQRQWIFGGNFDTLIFDAQSEPFDAQAFDGEAFDVSTGYGFGGQAFEQLGFSTPANRDYLDRVLDLGAISLWGLGDVDGTVVADSTGLHDGTQIDNPTMGVEGIPGAWPNQAVRFDGVNTQRIITAWSTIPTPPLTIEAWIRWDGVTWPTNTTIAGWFSSSGVLACRFWVSGNGSSTINIRLGTEQGNANANLQATLDDLEWHHLVGTIDGTNGNARLYLDGALVAGPSGVTFNGGASANPFWIGNGDDLGFADASWPGDIDAVAVYPTALSLADIGDTYDLGLTEWGAGYAFQTDNAFQADAFQGEGDGEVTGTAALVDANDTLSATGTLTITGTSALTDRRDTSASSGLVANPVTGTSALEDANDTMTASGALTITGTSALTDARDTMTASGSSVLTITGTSSLTDANDEMAATGISAVTATGTATLTDASDEMAATGSLVISGTAVLIDANDTMASTGLLSITGIATLIDANDVVVATGALTITGTSSLTDSPDGLAATGIVANPVSGTATLIDSPDTMSATGRWFIVRHGGVSSTISVETIGSTVTVGTVRSTVTAGRITSEVS